MGSAAHVRSLTKAELHNVLEHINSCLIHQHESAVLGALDWLRDFAECDRLVFCQIDRTTPFGFKELINHSYGSDWIETYRNRQFCQVDPVVQLALNKEGKICWREAYRLVDDARAKEFIKISQDHGLTGGVAHSYTEGRLTSLCSMTDSPRQSRGLEFVLESLAPAIHLSLCSGRYPCKSPLSAREIEVLQWASNGKTVWEMSVILSVSQSTIKFHLANIYAKLNVRNRAQAMSAAVRLGLY